MFVAIQLEGMHLGDERILFKPVGVIKGEYNEKENIFIDEYNREYSYINGEDIYSDCFFCCPTTLEELKETYGEEKEDRELIECFFSSFNEKLFVGYFDYVTRNIRSIEIDFEKIAEEFLQEDYGLEIREESDIESFNVSDNDIVKNVINGLNILIAKKQTEEGATGECFDVSEEESGIKMKLDRVDSRKFTLKEMRDFVLSEIVAQDEAVKRITTCIMSNFNSEDCKRKKHLLLNGPTGIGKNKTIQLICEYLDVPYTKIYPIDYSQNGCVGITADEMIYRLIFAADGDIQKAQNGVIVLYGLEELNSIVNNYMFVKGVMDSLVEITSRGIVQISIIEDEVEKVINFDTSNLTVIFTGDFESLKSNDNEKEVNSLGFIKNEEENNIYDILIDCGLTPELIGNISCIVPFKSLNNEDYIKILRYSKSSPLIIEQEHYQNHKGIKLTFTSNFLKEVSKQAYKLNIGVRGLESVISKSLEDIEERVLSGEEIKLLKLTKKTALNNKEYYVKFK